MSARGPSAEGPPGAPSDIHHRYRSEAGMPDVEEDHEPVFMWSTGGIRRLAEKKSPAPSRARRPASPQSPLDSRRYPRLDLKLPILYKLVEGGVPRLPAAVRPFLLAQSRDVSPIGLCLTLAEPLPSGAVLALVIHVVERREKFDALARVVWSRPAGDAAHFLTGLQFVVVDGRRVKEERHLRMEALVRLFEER